MFLQLLKHGDQGCEKPLKTRVEKPLKSRPDQFVHSPRNKQASSLPKFLFTNLPPMPTPSTQAGAIPRPNLPSNQAGAIPRPNLPSNQAGALPRPMLIPTPPPRAPATNCVSPPRGTTRRAYIPATPRKVSSSQTRAPRAPHFPRMIRKVSHHIQADSVRSDTSYRTPKGREHPLLKQGSSKDCGSAAALMCMFSAIPARHHNSAASLFTEAYWKWHFNAYLENPRTITDAINNHTKMQPYLHLKAIPMVCHIRQETKPTHRDGSGTHVYVIHKAAFLRYIQAQLENSGQSIILGIDHPRLGGHSIVIDEFSGGYYSIRDPHTGNAYSLTPRELGDMVADDCGINLVYFNSNDEEL